MRPWLILPLITGVGSGGCGLVLAQEVTRRDLEALVGSAWYAVLIGGQRVGYAHMSVALGDTGDGLQVIATEHSVIKLRVHDLSLGVTSTQITRYNEQLKPISWHVEQDEMGRPKEIEAFVRGDGQLEVITRSSGDETVRTVQVEDDFEGEVRAFLAVMRGEVEIGDTLAFQTFVPYLGVVDQIRITVTQRQRCQLGDHEVEALVMTTEFAELGLTGVMSIASDGTLVRMELPGLLNGTGLQWVTEEEALSEASPMEMEDHIPLAVSLGNTRSLARVRLKVRSLVASPAELVPETPVQKVRPVDAQTALVEVRAETDEGLEGRTVGSLRSADVALDLAPSINAQSDDPAIIARAQEIVGEEKDAWQATKLLVRWLYSHLGKMESEPRPISAKEVLEQMRGDCSEHATLLVALCRAAGIPCRFVTGVVYTEGGREANEPGYYYHAWNQVYVGRWVSVDPAWGETATDAGHLALAAGSLDEKSFVRLSLATGRVMGTLKLEAISAVHTDGRGADFSAESGGGAQ